MPRVPRRHERGVDGTIKCEPTKIAVPPTMAFERCGRLPGGPSASASAGFLSRTPAGVCVNDAVPTFWQPRLGWTWCYY